MNENKQELIIRSAIRILEKENYQNMKTAAIAQDAGIAEGTIYRYFKSKRDLFVEVLRFISKELASSFIQGVSPENSLRKNLKLLGENFYIRKKETAGLYKIMYKAFSEVEDEEIKRELATIYDSSIKIIREMIGWGMEETRLSISDRKLELILTMLWGLGDMLWKREMINNKRSTESGEVDEIVDLIYAMLA